MTQVRMLHYISGGRWDGRQWPNPEIESPVIDVPDWEARDLIRGGNAAPVPQSAAPAQDYQPAPVPVSPPEVSPVAEPAAAPAQAEAPAPAEEPPPAAAESGPEPAQAPGPASPKQAWIDYAVNVQGADVHAAQNMTKADLMSRYGGRL